LGPSIIVFEIKDLIVNHGMICTFLIKIVDVFFSFVMALAEILDLFVHTRSKLQQLLFFNHNNYIMQITFQTRFFSLM
jgi:hypothetical protein